MKVYKDDRGEHDLERQIEQLQLKVRTYEELMGDTKKLKCACAKETLLTILNKSTQKHHLALQNCDDFDFRINRHWIV